jgi:hypothetical protein
MAIDTTWHRIIHNYSERAVKSDDRTKSIAFWPARGKRRKQLPYTQRLCILSMLVGVSVNYNVSCAYMIRNLTAMPAIMHMAD